MTTWSFCDERTGLFVGRSYSGPAAALEANTPTGCLAVEGQHDPLSQRVDVETGEVVDYQPPQPDDDHEWDDEARRWVLTAAASERIAQVAAARAKIAELERKQARRVRELLAESDPQLKAIDDEIAQHRAVLARP